MPAVHSKKRWSNKFTYEEAVGRAAVALIGHPFDYAKILIQLGYEPLPPYPTKNIFGTPRLALPNLFTYLGYIRKIDGPFGYFRGVKYKIACSLLYNFVYINISDVARTLSSNQEETESADAESSSAQSEGSESTQRKQPKQLPPFSQENLRKTLEALMRETFCKFLSLAVSYPLHLMVIRSCAQFIGRETVYDTFTGGFKDIYENSGWSGFYAGFMPRFLYDVLVLWSTHGILLLVKGCVIDKLVSGETSSSKSLLETYVNGSISFILASAMYPFHVVSTVMACNGRSAASLEASALEGREFGDWIDCWKYLSSTNQLKRGPGLFWRYQPLPRKVNYSRGLGAGGEFILLNRITAQKSIAEWIGGQSTVGGSLVGELASALPASISL